MTRFFGPFAFAVALASAPVANAVSFDCLQGSADHCATGQAQLQLAVSDAGGGLVQFTFSNLGPADSSITAVYFDTDAALQNTIASILNTSGVEFSDGASPPNLPGADGVTPSFVADLSADSDQPTGAKGVNPGESLGIRIALAGGATFGDVLAELASGDLRVGAKVEGLGTFVNQSSAFASQASVPNPEPDAALLFLAGTALVARSIRRRR